MSSRLGPPPLPRVARPRAAPAVNMLYPVLVKHPRCRPLFRLGHYGVVAARVLGSSIRFYDRDDVEGLGIDAMRVHLRARENLRTLMDSGEIPIRGARTSTGSSFLVIEHPLASSCLFAGPLRDKARLMFGYQRIIAVILRRNTLVVFADPGARGRDAMARGIARHVFRSDTVEDEEMDLFWLDDADPRPIQSSSPSSPALSPSGATSHSQSSTTMESLREHRPAPPPPSPDEMPTYLEGNARRLVLEQPGPRPSRSTQRSGLYPRDHQPPAEEHPHRQRYYDLEGQRPSRDPNYGEVEGREAATRVFRANASF